MRGKEVISLSAVENSAEIFRNEFCTALQGVREELDEHLETINQATEEVQSNYEYLSRLDEKIDRLNEKVERLAMAIGKFHPLPEEAPVQIELSDKEKEVFLVLYTAHGMLSYHEIAQGVRESEFLVRGHVTNMIQKGLPIRKKYAGNYVLVYVDSQFREMQARTNILNISQKTVREFS